MGSLDTAPRGSLDIENTAQRTSEDASYANVTGDTFTGDVYFKSGRPWVDAVAYGADPTGAADSTAAIAAAIAGGNKVVYFPPGTYMTDQITVPAGTRLLGAGRTLSILKFRAASTGYLLEIAAADIVVEHLKLDADRTVATSATGGIRLNGATRFRLRFCWITKTRSFAIAYNGLSNSDIFIDNNTIDDPLSSGIDNAAADAFSILHSISDFRISNNRITKSGGTTESGVGVRLTLCARGEVIGNYVDSVAANWVNGLPIGMGSTDIKVVGNTSRRHRDDGCTIYYGSKRIPVEGNDFSESRDTCGVFIISGVSSGLGAPYTDPCESIEITGNTLDSNFLAGIRFEALINSSIVGNSICRGGRYGILQPGGAGSSTKGVVIEGNTICENDESGINVSAGSHYEIIGNSIKNNGKDTGAEGDRSGIIINGADYSQVNNNKIIDDQGTATTTFGIRLLNADYCQVNGNYCRGVLNEGIYLDASTNNQVVGNKIHEVSNTADNTTPAIRLLNASVNNLVASNQVRKKSSANRTSWGILSTSNDNTIINNDLVNAGQSGAYIETGSPTGTIRFGNVGDARLRATTTWDPANLALGTGDSTSTTVSVTDAALGDVVLVSFSVAVPAKCILTGQVTAAGTVTITLVNLTAGAVDLASGTLTVVCEKRAA